MIRILIILLIFVVFVWLFNNFSSKTKSPLSLKLNTILKFIFFVLVLIGIILTLPRFGFNPLALVQKVLPLLGML